jgi:tetratricopeptide (TPR) repeat protein
MNVEPIGTITKFYPFLDQVSRLQTEDIVSSALNYRDFVMKLVDLVCSHESSLQMFFMAMIHAWDLDDAGIWETIRPKCAEYPLTKPWSFWGGDHMDLEACEQAHDEALSLDPDILMRLHLNIFGLNAFYQKPHIWIEYQKRTLGMIEEHPELKCFSLRALNSRLKGFSRSSTGNQDEIMNWYQTTKKIARECGDVYHEARATQHLGQALTSIDLNKAMKSFEEACQIFQSLDDKSNAAYTIIDIAEIYGIKGEYDLAIEFSFKAVDYAPKHWGIGGYVDTGVANSVARICNLVDLPDQALEWTRWKTESSPNWENDSPIYIARLKLEMARAHTKLGQYVEAHDYLEQAHSLILSIGMDVGLAYYNGVLGAYDLATGNPNSAMHYLEQSLQEFERLNASPLMTTCCLLDLTRTEIVIISENNDYSNPETSGQWMTKLDQHARENEFPGVMMQHALLKAEYQEQIGETEAAILTLQDALTFSDSPGVKTLRERILKRLDELETSVKA